MDWALLAAAGANKPELSDLIFTWDVMAQLFGGVVGTVAGVVVPLCLWLSSRFKSLEREVHGVRTGLLEVKSALSERVAVVETKVDAIDAAE